MIKGGQNLVRYFGSLADETVFFSASDFGFLSLIKHDMDTEVKRDAMAFLHCKDLGVLRDCTGYYDGMEMAEHAHKGSDGKEMLLADDMVPVRTGDED